DARRRAFAPPNTDHIATETRAELAPAHVENIATEPRGSFAPGNVDQITTEPAARAAWTRTPVSEPLPGPPDDELAAASSPFDDEDEGEHTQIGSMPVEGSAFDETALVIGEAE